MTIPLALPADRALNKRLCEVVRSPSQNVVLVLKDVEADAPPGASWEVYVEPAGLTADPQDRYLVGIVSLFDRGVGWPQRQNRDSAEFVFVLDRAIAAAGTAELQLRFAPTSGVTVDGRPQAAEVRSEVTIGEISLAIDAAPRQ